MGAGRKAGWTRGIPRRMKLPATSANLTARRPLRAFPDACTAYPGRTTRLLKVEADAGTQTRLFHFAGKPPQAGDLQWQGFSMASWDHQAGGGFGPPGAGGSLKVVTTKMKAGYLRKNGAPLQRGCNRDVEYFDALKEPDGEQYLIVKTLVDDPQYLSGQILSPASALSRRNRMAPNGIRRPAPRDSQSGFTNTGPLIVNLMPAAKGQADFQAAAGFHPPQAA